MSKTSENMNNEPLINITIESNELVLLVDDASESKGENNDLVDAEPQKILIIKEDDKQSNAPESNASNEDVSRDKYGHIWVLLIVLAIFCVVVIVAVLMAKAQIPDNVGRELQGDELAQVIEENSPLIDYAYLSPNATFPREGQISKITIHHVGGDETLEQIGKIFQDKDRQSSANYAIDSRGNVGIYVEEENRSWASSNRENDSAAVTIEVANDEIGGNWHVSSAAYEKLIDLVVDICERNGIERLNYTSDTNGNLTYHKMFNSDTLCPGPYLTGRMSDIASEVNSRLAAE